MKEFHCKVMSCEKVFYDGPCVSLVIPAYDGEYAFLANHQTCVVVIPYGILRLRKARGGWIYCVVSLGVVHFVDNEATVLVDFVEEPERVNEVRAREVEEMVEEELRQQQSLVEYKATQAHLARTLHRLSGRGQYDQGGDFQ